MKLFYYYLSVFTALAVGLFTQSSAEHVEAANFAEIDRIFKEVDKDTLGVFAIEGVLAHSSDPAFQRGNWRGNQQFVKNVLKAFTPQECWLFSNLSIIESPLQAIDSQAWSVIQRIQERKLKTIAFTGSMSGLLNGVYLQDWFYEQLKRLNVDFSNSFPKTPSFYMNDLCDFMGRFPVFYKGILCANGDSTLKKEGCNREDVLVEFFRKMEWRPKKVLYVDDHIANLDALQKTLALYDPDIQFVGVHFTYVPIPEFVSQEEFQKSWNKVRRLVGAEK